MTQKPMKNSIINLVRKTGIMVLTMAAVFGVHAATASAAYSMNSLSNDCRTVTIANYTTGQGSGSPCWTGSSISADDGETFNVAIYYHNSGDTPAPNVSMRIDNPSGNQSGTVSIRGQLYVNGTAVSGANGTVRVTVPTDATITFDSVQVQTQ